MKFELASIVFLFILLNAGLSGCLKEEDLNLKLKNIDPIELGDGLTISTPSNELMDEKKLRDAYEYANTEPDLWPIRSLLVFRNGNLVSEHYFKDKEDIQQSRLIWSATKQVTAVLVGIAIEMGLIQSLDDPISMYLENELVGHQEKTEITIRDLITMRSGIGFSNDGVGGETDQLLRQKPSNSVDFILNLPMIEIPGTKFNYNDGDPHLLSAIIQKQAGMPTDEWATEVFFSKLGVSNLNWVRYKDGITFGGFGIETTAREMGKIGLCIADKGMYDMEQIVSEVWVNEMTHTQVQTEFDDDMGYYWWINQPRNVHSMNGHGGQYVYIVPDKDLVIVMTAIPNTQDDYQIQPDEALLVVDLVVESCI